MWKTSHTGLFLPIVSLLICCAMLTSCGFFKTSKKDPKPAVEATASAEEAKKPEEAKAPPEPEARPEKKKGFFSFFKGDEKKPFLDSSLIDHGEDDVKKSFGEPDVVAKTPENMIIWTYKPKWKLLPDNADTVYVEFENGKVRKIVRATR